jgi:hypothetical protein
MLMFNRKNDFELKFVLRIPLEREKLKYSKGKDITYLESE